jgi:CubicO group peptidase (beta-lactamase class C family)
MNNKILVIAFLLFTSILKAQTGVSFANFTEVDNKINDFMNKWKVNGAGVAITKDGKLIYNKGFGFSDQQKLIPSEPNNLYRIASVSKPITSIAIMKLIQDDRLSITDTVFGEGKILDQDYYKSVISDKRIYSVTIQNLLEHTTGWDRSFPCDGYSHSDAPFFPLHVTSVLDEPNPVGDSTLIKFLLLKGLNHDPGTTYAYSNVGYLVLGKVIEKITGMKYEDYIQSGIFEPLGIHDIHLGKNLLANALERESQYNNSVTTESCYGDGTVVPWQYGGFNIEAMNAHGGWVASPSDLTKLMLAIDGFKSSPDILNFETIDLMSSAGSANPYYAKGWCVNPGNNWWHTGCMDGTSSFICRTNDGYTWAFLFNSRSTNSTAFWNEFDKLPWNCMKVIKEIPDISLFAPTKNVSEISASVLNSGSVNVSWVNGNGDGRIILATEKNTFDFPIDGMSYIPNSGLTAGTKIGNHTYVVYNGTDNHFNLMGLDPAKTYLLSAFEYYKNKNTGNYPVYELGNNEKKIITTNPLYAQDSKKLLK